MFARFLKMTIEPEKKPELLRTLKEEVLPILNKYPGFFELIPLEVETDHTKFYAISLWHDKADMEKYAKEHFPRAKAMIERYLAAPLIVRPCAVDETVARKLALAVAVELAY